LSEYPERRDDLIQVFVDITDTQPLEYPLPCSGWSCVLVDWLHLKASHPFGSFSEHGSKHSFRRMAAWLVAYRKRYQGRGDYKDLVTNPKALSKAPQMVEDWTRSITRFARPGSDTKGGPADYDMGWFTPLRLTWACACGILSVS